VSVGVGAAGKEGKGWVERERAREEANRGRRIGVGRQICRGIQTTHKAQSSRERVLLLKTNLQN